MLIAYTCSGQKSGAHAYTLITYTCSGPKSKVNARSKSKACALDFYPLQVYVIGKQLCAKDFCTQQVYDISVSVHALDFFPTAGMRSAFM